jgi:hypothetical protein
MSQSETAILVLFVAFYLPTFALYHFMVFRVNKHLAPTRRTRHSTSFLSWSRLGESYREFYPESFLYSFTRSSAIVLLLIAVRMVVLRLWEYGSGK